MSDNLQNTIADRYEYDHVRGLSIMKGSARLFLLKSHFPSRLEKFIKAIRIFGREFTLGHFGRISDK